MKKETNLSNIRKKQKIIMIVISALVVLSLLFTGFYLFLHQYIPEININTDVEHSVGWKMDKHGTVQIYGNSYLPSLYSNYLHYIYDLETGKQFITNMAGHINPGFHAKHIIIDDKVIGYSKTKEFSDYAFVCCDEIESFEVDKDNQYLSSEDGVLFNKDKTVLLRYPTGNHRSLYKVPESVTEIAADAFEGCVFIKTVTCSSLLEKVGKSAFANSGLETIIFENGVMHICDNAFNGCTELKNVDFGDNVEYIEEYVFYGCNQLLHVTLPDSIVKIGYLAFGYSGNMTHPEAISGFTITCSNSATIARYYAEENGFLIKDK